MDGPQTVRLQRGSEQWEVSVQSVRKSLRLVGVALLLDVENSFTPNHPTFSFRYAKLLFSASDCKSQFQSFLTRTYIKKKTWNQILKEGRATQRDLKWQ